jgi:hypothetical protein
MWDKKHLRNIGFTEQQIDKIFDAAIKDIAALSSRVNKFDFDKPFTFADYPELKRTMSGITETLNKNLAGTIKKTVLMAWELSNDKNDATYKQFGRTYDDLMREQNQRAMNAFLNRKTAGLNLSDRVWNYTSQFKAEIEMGVDLGLRDGLSAPQMARDLKQYLKNPDNLYRRFRFRDGTDDNGKAVYSTKWKQRYFDDVTGKYKFRDVNLNDAAHKPGRGVYRSSYKNARRLAATETNIAYHTNDFNRWQEMDFVVGIEVKLSNNHTLNGKPFTDICDDLKGKYPKDFKFTGWHPLCRCFAVSILKTPDEMAADNDAILDGGEPSEGSVNTVKNPPDNFTSWVDKNTDRIKDAQKRGTLPYFIKDNKGYVNLKKSVTPYIMTDKGVSELRSLGFDVDFANHRMTDADFAAKFNSGNMKGFNLPEFDKDLQNTIKSYDPNMTIKQKTLTFYDHKNEYVLHYYGLIDGENFLLTRLFKKNNVVEHELFALPKSAQNKGLSKAIFRDLYKQYQNAGVKKIEVHANIDVGGYTWGKYGFTANKNEYSFLISHANSQQKAGLISDADNRNFQQWLRGYKDKDIPIYEVAYGKKYGKDLLLGSDWEGYINFSNAKTKKIFEDYLAK